ncbi:MAG: Formate dehydrogenase [Solirubrobacterales bacterium]|nr:Formate dehydrogenase [Solirubrobacterales bacterium]
MGSNMAEQHPVGFQWVMEAKQRGARVLHVDPRFTRTSAVADTHVALRGGTDIVFLGALINHVLEGGHDFRDYVRHYTNARIIVEDDFRDTEDLDGLFSGWDREQAEYDQQSWGYAPSGGDSDSPVGQQAHGAHGAGEDTAQPPFEDWSLEDPRCVFQILRRHFSRYTPEMVEQVCGVSRERFGAVADALVQNSGPDRTSAICYAVGWTQHTTGVQTIRAAAILQLLLGNIGRPGGGIMALRGHANIQGSTDIPTLYDILPGYIPMPAEKHTTFDEWNADCGPRTGVWGWVRRYQVSMMKAWFGEHATAESDWGFDLLPQIGDDHSHYAMCLRMIEGTTKGFVVLGQNPVVGSAHGALQRKALVELDWLVVRDTNEIETAAFWHDSPEIESGDLRSEDIGTEVFLLPAATHVEKSGTFTNTQRLLQHREKAVDPPGDCRSDLWFAYHLFRRVRERLAGSVQPRDRAVHALTWDYPVDELGEPDPAAVLQEINGRHADGSFVSGYDELRDDGTTACGSWLHAGCYAEGVNQVARRRPGGEQNWIAHEWGWAWPMDRRMLYSRASADPDGRPWSERKRYAWWDAEAGSWATLGDNVDFVADRPPGYVPPEGAEAMDAIGGRDPFIVHPDGLGWLYASSGVLDGPLPTHYEPQESPIDNLLYGERANPTRERLERPDNPVAPPKSRVFPFVLSTYRLTEHHTAGGMSRTVEHLSELQPELFCEVSPALAALRGLEHGGWATIVSARTAIEARVMVTERVKPIRAGGIAIHQVGVPYHFGRRGIVTGDSANDLLPLVLDRNVHINEAKTSACDIVAGRRPRGAALAAFVAEYRSREDAA